MGVLNKLFKSNKSSDRFVEKDKDIIIKNLKTRIRRLNYKIFILNTNIDTYKNKILNNLMFEIPFSIGSTVYWIIDDINERNLKEFVVYDDSGKNLGITKFTIAKYIISEHGVGIQFEELLNKGQYTFMVPCDYVGEYIFDNYDRAFYNYKKLVNK